MVKDALSLPDDAELIARAQGGDAQAFGELYQRYLNPIYRYIRARVAEDQTAEDLTELVFLRSFEVISRYKERGLPYSAFLYQVARNLLIDHYREQREELELEDVDQMAAPAKGMDERFVQVERIKAIENALADLPSDYQEVIRLRVVLAMPTTTVAEWMGRSEGAVRVLLFRALKTLRGRLDEHEK
jgi:RNA polymerase sigma-70 factor (ECF subfamily)